MQFQLLSRGHSPFDHLCDLLGDICVSVLNIKNIVFIENNFKLYNFVWFTLNSGACLKLVSFLYVFLYIYIFEVVSIYLFVFVN